MKFFGPVLVLVTSAWLGAACSKPSSASESGLVRDSSPSGRLVLRRHSPHEAEISFVGLHRTVRSPFHSRAAQIVTVEIDSPERAASALATTDADPRLKDRLLVEAATKGHPNTVKYLIARGARANAPAVVEAATLSGSVQTLRTVLDAGGDLRLVRGDGYRLIHLAAMSDSPEMIRYLVKRGASIDARSVRNRETPLFVAALNGKAKAIKALLELGARRSLPDATNTLPADAARNHGHGELSEMLAPIQHRTLWQH